MSNLFSRIVARARRNHVGINRLSCDSHSQLRTAWWYADDCDDRYVSVSESAVGDDVLVLFRDGGRVASARVVGGGVAAAWRDVEATLGLLGQAADLARVAGRSQILDKRGVNLRS